jgi:hypothetical protein
VLALLVGCDSGAVGSVASSPDGAASFPASRAAGSTSDLVAASDDVAALGARAEYREFYAGIVDCEKAKALLVYRLPGNKRLDAALAAVGAHQHMQLIITRSQQKARDVEGTRAEVMARADDLAAADAPLTGTGVAVPGVLEVAVQRNPEAARKVLADLGDGITVVEREPAVPAVAVATGPSSAAPR